MEGGKKSKIHISPLLDESDFLNLQWSGIQHMNVPFFVIYTFFTAMVISINLLKPSIFLNIAVNMLQGHLLVFKPAYTHTYRICIL